MICIQMNQAFAIPNKQMILGGGVEGLNAAWWFNEMDETREIMFGSGAALMVMKQFKRKFQPQEKSLQKHCWRFKLQKVYWWDELI